MSLFLSSKKRWQYWAWGFVARDLLFRTSYRAISSNMAFWRNWARNKRFHFLVVVDDAREKSTWFSKRSSFALIGFDARGREDEKNHFGSCFWSYFAGEKPEMMSKKTRKKIAFFHFFGFGAFTARAVSPRKYKLQGNFFYWSSQNWMLYKRCKFHRNLRTFLYGVVEIPWIQPNRAVGVPLSLC